MIFRFVHLQLLLTAVGLADWASAMQASPEPFNETQPDGTVVTLRMVGDDNEHFMTDVDGYTVDIDDDGDYVYLVEEEDDDDDDDDDDDEVAVVDPPQKRGDFAQASKADRANQAHKAGKATKAVKSKEKVGRSNPQKKGLKKGIKPERNCFKQLCGGVPLPPEGELEETELLLEPLPLGYSNSTGGINVRRRRATQTTGVLRNLVVLIRFNDHKSRTLPPPKHINALMNANKLNANLFPTGSLKRLYREFSYGQLTIQSRVTGWVTVSKPERYYADGNGGTTNLHEALREALTVLENIGNIDFSNFDTDGDGYIDSITFLHSGYGAEWGSKDCYGSTWQQRIWSHKWALYSDSTGQWVGPWKSKDNVRVYDYHISPGVWGTCGSKIGRIGVIAHETGHFLGLPDLYDTNGGGRGLGGYCLMASSWGFDGSQYYPGFPSAWARVKAGWVVPQEPYSGVNLIANAEQAPGTEPTVYIVGEKFGYPPGEYLLIENRQKYSVDSKLPGTGLAIYHIDQKANFNQEGYLGQPNWPQNGKHYRVALIPADAKYHLERGINGGDGQDFFRHDTRRHLQPNNKDWTRFPNTDRYQGGVIRRTGVRIVRIGASQDVMRFEFLHPKAEARPT